MKCDSIIGANREMANLEICLLGPGLSDYKTLENPKMKFYYLGQSDIPTGEITKSEMPTERTHPCLCTISVHD